jgi:hypothetical protein
VHILEGHSEHAVAGEIDGRSVRQPGFDRLGDNFAATWFLWERDANLCINNRELKNV